MAVAEYRFYEELNDFLPPARRKRSFTYDCARRATVKNAIEALGIPHTEVEVILVNGESVDFRHIVQDGDRISVYPQFETFDISPLLRVREQPLRHSRFIADAHLGALAKYLRILGFDTLYRNSFDDREVASIAAAQRRIVLSRDKGLLMHRSITHGCYVRARKPLEQVEEILARLDLYRSIAPLTRCLLCNAPLDAISKEEVSERVPANTMHYYDDFRTCRECDRIYWAGSHFRHLQGMLDNALQRCVGGVQQL